MQKSLQISLLSIFLAVTAHSQTGKVQGQSPALLTNSPVKVQTQTQLLNRGCATGVPSAEWEAEFQKQIQEFKNSHSLPNGKTQMAAYNIPVIIHVIHGGQPVGTFPNLAQGQLNSQITVLNQDFGGTGLNVSNYPAGAFSAYATAASLPSGNLDGSGRVAISNTNIQFCLAEKDSLGNILAEPGIERINYTSKGWANPNSFTSISSFQSFINNTVKPQTIWNVSKYLNIWVTDENSSVGLLGFATFPVSSTLPGLSGVGTSSTDGFWAWANCFGSVNIFPSGTYIGGYDLGRTCTHEIAHWLGLRHIWGDGTCATDYCLDTPPASGSNFNTPTYPFKSGSCAGPPSNSPNGEMFMNFMDYTNDVAMYMFTTDQTTRMQTAMANSPYRKFLGTHGLCGGSTAFCGDTITNVVNTQSLTLATAGADVSTTGCSPKAGYIFGSNCYKDKEKAEFFPLSLYSSISTPKITSVIVIFYKDGTRGTGGNSSTPVDLKLYTGSMAGGPTNISTPLGVVNSNIGNILAAPSTTNVTYCGNSSIIYTNPILKPYRFVTTSPITAPATSGFFASLTLPTTAGDTAVVMHAAASSGSNWEMWSDNSWNNIASTWGSFNASMAILPVISCNYVGVNETASVLNEGINLMPNPSSGIFNLVATLPNTQDLTITVTNALGQIISNSEFNAVNNNVFTIDLSSKENGVYFVSISNGEERIVKKVVIAK